MTEGKRPSERIGQPLRPEDRRGSVAPKSDTRGSGSLPPFPVLEYRKEIVETFQRAPTILVVGETGSGKTTQIPGMLLAASAPDARIAVTEPRKIAARSVARFVAEQEGCKLGEKVGFQTRDEKEISEDTRLAFVTDGIILRKLQYDPLLKEYDVVMVDEAHERSLNIDFLIGLLKRAQELRAKEQMKPLKIVVASATLEKEKFAAYFGGAPLVEVPGRLYPVHEHFLPDPLGDVDEEEINYIRAAVDRVGEIMRRGKRGDILIFMPGEEDIRATIKKIEEELKDLHIECIPLYGQLDAADQDKIFHKPRGPRVIVATNIAETSITPPYATTIIDSGLIKQKEYNPESDFESLLPVQHSQAGCKQREGRAGRVEEGDYYALFSRKNLERRPKFTKPEIQRLSLDHVVLTMKDMGIADVYSFPFIDKPEAGQLEQAVKTLQALGALDADGNITEIGKSMAEFTIEPKVSRMIIEAQKYHCAETVCTIAAFIGSTKPVFFRPRDEPERTEADRSHRSFHHSSSDFLTYLNVWRAWEASDFDRRWAKDSFLSSKALDEIGRIRAELMQTLKKNGAGSTKNGENEEAITKSIASGLIANLCVRQGRYTYTRQRDGADQLKIHPGSSTFQDTPEIIAAHRVRSSKSDRGGINSFLMHVQEIRPEWLSDIAPHLLKRMEGWGETFIFDASRGMTFERIRYRIRDTSYEFDSGEKQVQGEKATAMIIDAIFSNSIDSSSKVYKAHQKNIQLRSELLMFFHRSGGQTKRVTDAALRDFYTTQLAGASTLAEAEARYEQLLLSRAAYITPEEEARVIQENPSTLLVGGKSCPVVYGYDEEKGRRTASVRLDDEKMIRSLPDDFSLALPDGTPVLFQYYLYGEGGKTLQELRRIFKEKEEKGVWEAFQYKWQLKNDTVFHDFREQEREMNRKEESHRRFPRFVRSYEEEQAREQKEEAEKKEAERGAILANDMEATADDFLQQGDSGQVLIQFIPLEADTLPPLPTPEKYGEGGALIAYPGYVDLYMQKSHDRRFGIAYFRRKDDAEKESNIAQEKYNYERLVRRRKILFKEVDRVWEFCELYDSFLAGNFSAGIGERRTLMENVRWYINERGEVSLKGLKESIDDVEFLRYELFKVLQYARLAEWKEGTSEWASNEDSPVSINKGEIPELGAIQEILKEWGSLLEERWRREVLGGEGLTEVPRPESRKEKRERLLRESCEEVHAQVVVLFGEWIGNDPKTIEKYMRIFDGAHPFGSLAIEGSGPGKPIQKIEKKKLQQWVEEILEKETGENS